jgi:hypothetical protein
MTEKELLERLKRIEQLCKAAAELVEKIKNNLRNN